MYSFLIFVIFLLFACVPPLPSPHSGDLSSIQNTEINDDNTNSLDESHTNQKKNVVSRNKDSLCALPECIFDTCCRDGNSCFSTCTDLGFDKDICETLSRTHIDELSRIFKIIKYPQNIEDPINLEYFYKKISDNDIQLICGSVSENTDILKNHVADYSPQQAKYFLTWLVDKYNSIKIFTESGQDNTGGVFKKIYQNLDTNNFTVLNKILKTALDKNNKDLIQYIHNEIIVDTICTENFTTTKLSFSPYSDSEASSSSSNVKQYSNIACVLGVYCYINNQDNIQDKFIFNISKILDNTSYFTDIMKAELVDGGFAQISPFNFQDACTVISYTGENQSGGWRIKF